MFSLSYYNGLLKLRWLYGHLKVCTVSKCRGLPCACARARAPTHSQQAAKNDKLSWTLNLLPVAGENAFVDDHDEKRADSVEGRGQQLEHHRGTLAGRRSGRGSCGRQLGAAARIQSPFMELCHPWRRCGNGSLLWGLRMRTADLPADAENGRKVMGSPPVGATVIFAVVSEPSAQKTNRAVSW